MRYWFKKGAWASKKGWAAIDCLDPEAVRSIAVIRHSALGDMLLTRPFLVEARRAFPRAQITFSVLESYTRGLPEDLVDRIHVVHNKKTMGHALKSRLDNLRDLGPHDMIFDLADTSRSLLLCALNQARLKIGFPYRTLYRSLFYDAAVFRSDFVFEAENLLHLLQLLGIRTAHPPDFRIKSKPYPSRSPYLVYFTGASTDAKRWSKEKFKPLIAEMSKAYPQHDHMVLKGIGEGESIAELFEGLEHQSNLKRIEIEKLEETLSFIQGATMVISNDTGIRHLAIASGVPTLGLFFGRKKGGTQPFRYWPRYGQHDIVYRADGSEPSVEEAFRAAGDMMDRLERAKEKDGMHYP